METKVDLNPKTIDAIQDLIQANIDSADGFTEAAKETDDGAVATMFTEFRAHREKHAAELQYYVVLNGERPPMEGTWLAVLQRIWLDLRAKLSGGDVDVILSEVAKAEEHLKSAYETSLKDTAGSALNDVLLKHFGVISDDLKRLATLRDEMQTS